MKEKTEYLLYVPDVEGLNCVCTDVYKPFVSIDNIIRLLFFILKNQENWYLPTVNIKHMMI